MALVAIEGMYENGRIELAERPVNVEKARVIVAFFPADNKEGDEGSQEDARHAAAERIIARMQAGMNFGGQKFDRADLYEERMHQLDARREQEK